MSAIGGISNINTTSFDIPREVKKSLGSEDFMKLLTVQLANQDPLNPMEDKEFIAQMSSFTSLEQMQDLVSNFSDFNDMQKISSAQNFLGREVFYNNDDGVLTSGTATSIRTDNAGKVRITVGQDEIPVEAIKEVHLGGGDAA